MTSEMNTILPEYLNGDICRIADPTLELQGCEVGGVLRCTCAKFTSLIIRTNLSLSCEAAGLNLCHLICLPNLSMLAHVHRETLSNTPPPSVSKVGSATLHISRLNILWSVEFSTFFYLVCQYCIALNFRGIKLL